MCSTSEVIAMSCFLIRERFSKPDVTAHRSRNFVCISNFCRRVVFFVIKVRPLQRSDLNALFASTCERLQPDFLTRNGVYIKVYAEFGTMSRKSLFLFHPPREEGGPIHGAKASMAGLVGQPGRLDDAPCVHGKLFYELRHLCHGTGPDRHPACGPHGGHPHQRARGSRLPSCEHRPGNGGNGLQGSAVATGHVYGQDLPSWSRYARWLLFGSGRRGGFEKAYVRQLSRSRPADEV